MYTVQCYDLFNIYLEMPVNETIDTTPVKLIRNRAVINSGLFQPLYILDSERSDECTDFTIMSFFFYYLNIDKILKNFIQGLSYLVASEN